MEKQPIKLSWIAEKMDLREGDLELIFGDSVYLHEGQASVDAFEFYLWFFKLTPNNDKHMAFWKECNEVLYNTFSPNQKIQYGNDIN